MLITTGQRDYLVIVSILLCLSIPGCQPTTTESEHPANADPTEEGSSNKPVTDVRSPNSIGAEKLNSQAVPTLCPTQKQHVGLMSLDPRQDGWDSEYLNSVAGKQLKRFGKLFDSGKKITAKNLESFVSQGVVSTLLVPTTSEASYQSDHVKVFQSNDVQAEPSIQGIDAFAAALDLLSSRFPKTSRHAKFKIIRVWPRENGDFSTEQLVSFNGHDEGSALEQNSTWVTEWTYATKDSPKLKSVTVKAFEQAAASSGPLFRDMTSTVLSGKNEQDIAERQFGVGVDQWVRRLDYYQLVFQFGHNGVSVGDVNGDGREDIYSCQLGGLPNRLFVAQSDGTVRDQAAEYGVDFLDNTTSALLIDLDNDGDQDLVVAFPFQLVFLENVGTRFEKRKKVDVFNAFSLAAADYDLDGDLDVYACVYFADRDTQAELPVPMPIYNATNGGANVLLRNDGQWHFEEVTATVGLDEDNSRYSYAAIWDDFNNDGQVDLFVANDFGRNNLYQNEGGSFRDVTEETGAIDDTFGMSAASADINRDGWVDVYKANMFSSAGNRVATQPRFLVGAEQQLKDKMLHLARGNTLLVNREGRFSDESVERGVAMGRWSWGSIFLDFNNDGWEDLFVTNGFVTGPNPDDL